MAAPTEKLCLAPLPQTKRGFGRTLYACSKKDGDWMIYTFGRHVIMRNLADPRISKMFSEHKANATIARFSPNGNWVASGDEHGKVLVWGTANLQIKNDVDVCSCINDIDWDNESKKIVAVGSGSGNLAKVFSYDSGNTLGDITNHSKGILSCAYKPTRPFKLATAGEDLSVNFYDGPPFKFAHSIQKHERYPNRVQYAPDGESFVTVGADNKICVYEGKTGEFQKEISAKDGHGGAIYSCCYSPDSKELLTCGADKTAKIWDLATGTVKTTFTVRAKPEVDDMQMAALWHKEYIVTVSLSGAINYWNPAAPGAPTKVVQGHMAQVTSLQSADGVFYSGDNAGKLSVWKDGVATWFTGKGHGKAISSLALSKNGQFVVTAGYDDTLRINECKSAEFGEGISLGGRPTAVCTGKTSDDLVVAVVAQGKICVLRKGAVVGSLDIKYKPNCVTLSPDDKEIMVGGDDKKVYFYSLTGDKVAQTRVVEKHSKAVMSVGYSPDGKTMSSASADYAILCCDDKGEIKNPSQWEFHSSQVNDHQWNTAGSKVVSVANDLSIYVFLDTAAFKTEKLCVKNAQMDSINCVAWVNDSEFVSGSGDGSIKVWGC